MIGISALLAQLLSVSDEVNKSDLLDTILLATCKATVEALNVEHSALMLFDEARQRGRVMAEFPLSFGAMNSEISLLEPLEQRLVTELKSIHIKDLTDPRLKNEFGSVLRLLRSLGIRSILIVPIISKGRAIGSFSLDVTSDCREFDSDEIALCELFAGQIAAAIDNLTWAKRTEELRVVALALSRTRSKENIYEIVIRHAVRLLDGLSGGIYEWNARTMELILVADPWRPHLIGTTLRIGEGIAGRLIKESGRILVQPDYQNFPGRASAFDKRSSFESVVEVRLQSSHNRPYGILYVDDRVGRRFNSADCRLLELFADHASVALEALESLEESKLTSTTLNFLEEASHCLAAGRTFGAGCEQLSRLLVDSTGAIFCRIAGFTVNAEPEVYGAAVSTGGLAGLERSLRGMTHENPTYSQRRLHDMGGVSVWLSSQEARSLFPQASLNNLDSILLTAIRNEKDIISMIELGFSSTRKPIVNGLLGINLSQRLTPIFIALQNLDRSLSQGKKVRATLDGCRELSSHTVQSNIRSDLLRIAADISDAFAVMLFEWHSESRYLSFVAEYGPGDRDIRPPILLQACIEGRVRSTRRGLPDDNMPVRVLETAAVPLKHDGVVTHVLSLWFDKTLLGAMPYESELIVTFGEFAASALNSIRSTESRSGIGHEVLWMVAARTATFLLEERLETKILHAILTALTAEYGLRFNRAAAFLFNESTQELTAALGIGQLELGRASKAWNEWRFSGRSTIDGYLAWLQSNMPEETDIDRAIKGLRIPVSRNLIDPFSAALFESQLKVIENPNDAEARIDKDFMNSFQPSSPLLVVPLRAGTRVIGIVVADARFTPFPISRECREFLQVFANLAGKAIDNLRKHNMGVTLESHPDWYTLSDPGEFLKAALNELRLREQARGASLFLINSSNIDVVSVGEPISTGFAGINISDNSAMVRVMNSRQVLIFTRETLTREFPSINFKWFPATSLALPFGLDSQSSGTLWMNYTDKKAFDDEWLRRLQARVDHAAFEYRIRVSWRFERKLAKAMEEFTRPTSQPDLAYQIATAAREIFSADRTAVWSYDEATEYFEAKVVGASGWSSDSPFLKPQFGNVIYGKMFKTGYVAESCGLERSEQPLSRSDQDCEIDFSGFQGIVLQTEGNTLGVMSLMYERTRKFSPEDETSLRRFASVASSALLRAKLMEQSTRLNNTTKLLMDLAGTSSLSESLGAIASRLESALIAQSVVLYSFNPDRCDFDYPPGTSGGVRNQVQTKIAGRLPEQSIVRHFMRRDLPYVSNNAQDDKIFRGRRFTIEENVGACLVLALHMPAAHETVGIMFVNYPKARTFSIADLENAQFFSNQAALLCRHVQMLGASRTLARQQSSLVILARKLLTSHQLDEVLEFCVRVAAEELDVEFADVVLRRNGQLILMQGIGWPKSYNNSHVVGVGTTSHAGFTINEKRAVMVEDFRSEVRFTIPPDIAQNEILSGMGVPMMIGFEVVGAILVHSRMRRHFTEDEVTFLSAVGTQAAIAIHHISVLSQQSDGTI